MQAIYKRTSAVGLAAATSANGTARNGASLATDLVHPDQLVMECTSAITTSSVVATFAVQVSMDATTWYTLKLPNNAANVATAAGTGVEVVTTLALTVPSGYQAYKFVRGVATLSGAATAGADTTTVTYRYIQMGGLEY